MAKDHKNAQELRRDLERLKASFDRQISAIEQRLDQVEDDSLVAPDPWRDSVKSSSPHVETKSAEYADPNKLTPSDPWNSLDESDRWLEDRIRHYGGKLLLFAGTQLGPLSQLAGLALDTYKHYRSQGRGSVFMMTAAGAIALVLGFGFLLQYSFNNLFGDLARVIFSFACAELILGLGIIISRHRESAADYASALIGVGVVLNYLSSFFLGPYYGLVGLTTGLVLFSLVTLTGIVLALIFQTRVVALVALLGGSLTPLIMDAAGAGGSYYYVYQLLIAAAYLWVAERIAWYPLTRVAFLVTAISIEYQLLAGGNSPDLLSIICMHGFFYLFGYHIILSHLRKVEQSKNISVAVGAALLIFFSVTLFQTVPDQQLLGWLYLVNALVLLACLYLVGLLQKPMLINPLPLITLGFGGLLGLAIYTLAGGQLLGVLWGFEGYLLVALGCKYSLSSARMEGYLTTAIGAVIGSYYILLWINQFPHLTAGGAWLQAAAFGMVLWLLLDILGRHKESWTRVDELAVMVSRESLSVWISLICLTSAAILIPDYWLASASIPLALLLIRSYYFKSLFTSSLALSHFFLLLAQAINGAVDAGSFMFRDLPLAAKISLLEAAACLWFFQYYFQRYYPESLFTKPSYYLRQFFYLLLPVFLLPRVLRSYPDFLAIALWGSLAISLILYRFTHSIAVKYEVLILVWTAILFSLISVALGGFSMPFSSVILGSGLLVLLMLGYLTPAWYSDKHLQSPYQQVLNLFPQYLAGCIWLVATLLTDDPGFACGLVVIYYACIILYWPLHSTIRASLTFSYAILWLMAIVAVIYHLPSGGAETPFFDAITLIAVAALLYRHQPHQRLLNRMLIPYPVKFWLFHGLILVAYVAALEHWLHAAFGPWSTVLLVIQATLVLFESQQPRFRFLQRLSLVLYAGALIKIVFFDMAGFSLVQKIMAFILIGIVLLVSAYQLQKYRDKNAFSG